MKPTKTTGLTKEPHAFTAGGQAVARELRSERKRWNLPLLFWKNDKFIAAKP